MISLAAAEPLIPAPKIEYYQLSPILIVFAAGVLAVVIEAFVPRAHRRLLQIGLSLTGLIAAFVVVCTLTDEAQENARAVPQRAAAEGSIAVDGMTLFLQGTILLLGVIAVLLLAERRLGGEFAASAATVPGSAAEKEVTRRGWTQTEIYPLMMFSIGGMLIFPAANDLLLMFVALEVLSLPLYLLCGLARRRRLLSQEAALKYFLLGAFSSAFFLYGIAMLYGYAGSVRLSEINAAVSGSESNDALLLIGMALLAVGLLFKVGAVPFHAWTPDVYQGAPTPITAFMAAATKVAAFGALLRVFYVGLGGAKWDWHPMFWGVAIATMLFGSLVALVQTDVKRMLAYSSIAHAGFILVGLVATNAEGLSATMFYLLAYGFSTIAAFAIVSLVRDGTGEATHLSQWAGLGRRSPVVGGLFALLLLAFAGIPLTSGFTAKFAVFSASVSAGATPLVVVGVLSSAIAAFFYIRVIVLMFFSAPVTDGPRVVVPSTTTALAVWIGVAVTVFLGVAPQPVLDLADNASFLIS
ncbi:NADH-quinone oxidoreductase subunit NuoN [Sporichthya polymorpha]|uniref:NADH-quinone oxidoreductase subunit NuoN n=1 Tax=Sporichthya polymorpha TaxID=35751 RepID=UPI00037F9441|nr:NADH-quinone oxidoreductase subunit NuoN [Sporichthya polymorpha]